METEENKENNNEPNFDINVPAVKSEKHNEVSLWQKDEINKFVRTVGIRECNTIPENVELIITFKEEIFKPQKYNYKSENGNGERAALVIDAIIKYNEDASQLVLGIEFPLALSKNGFMGLANYINATSKNFNLTNRTFSVFNVNRHTYKWKEVTEQEELLS